MSEAVAATGAEMVKKSAATWLEEKFGDRIGIDLEGVGVFEFARPVTWDDFEAISTASTAVRIEGGDMLAIMLSTLAMQVTDTDGIPDFDCRGADEPLSVFRARWRAYFGPVAAVIVKLYEVYNELTLPTARQRTFRPTV